jgi:competence protein ComEA
MNFLRQWIRSVFGFSGNEINGFLILIPFTMVLVLSEPLYRRWVSPAERQYREDALELDSLMKVLNAHHARSEQESPEQTDITRFPFDPNTAEIDELVQVGLPEHLANRIAAYRQKGGVFRVKSDLMKIYGLDSALYNQLYEYIRLPSRRLVHNSRDRAGAKAAPRKRSQERFDINTADTTVLKAVYGIGTTLAARIVKFRDGLGGFVSAQQLNEVYGLDSTVVKRLKDVCFIDPDFIPEKININTADEETLSKHPYIRYNLARAIVTYRYQHGDFATVTDIKNLWTLKPENLERLLPYLKSKD